jgi:hypothetical protein
MSDSQFVRVKRRLQARPGVEILETRVVPYSASGNAWPNPQLVTISFVPDGTVLAVGQGGNITSNMFATFNNIPGITSPSQWQNIILKAAQSWAAQTNVNFAVVSDDGSDAGSGNYQQGASNFGDIRIGAYNFGSGNTWLAGTFYPPPVNNYSIAGDVSFNSAYSFFIGSTYDLFTVAEHEIGHALGLGLSSSIGAVMYGTYEGAVAGLGSDDIAGVQSIYGARTKDSYDGGSGDNSFSTAANITSTIDPNALTSVINNLSITSPVNSQDKVTTADTAYYKFTAPSNSARTMSISVQSAGLSLLSPVLSVYNSSYSLLGTVNGKGQYGTTLTLNLNVTPGATYYIKVAGADNTVFSTGEYALTLNLGTGANPTVPLPNTQVLNGNPLQSGGGQPMFADPNTPPAGHLQAPSTAVANALEITGAGGPITTVVPVRTAAIVTAITAAQAATASAPLSPLPPSAVRHDTLIAPSDQLGDQPTAPPSDETETPSVGDAAPAVVPVDVESRDAYLAAAVETPTEVAASAPAVAEATSDSWTPDGTLAALAVLFTGPWLRVHQAHGREEQRKHHLGAPAQPKEK